MKTLFSVTHCDGHLQIHPLALELGGRDWYLPKGILAGLVAALRPEVVFRNDPSRRRPVSFGLHYLGLLTIFRREDASASASVTHHVAAATTRQQDGEVSTDIVVPTAFCSAGTDFRRKSARLWHTALSLWARPPPTPEADVPDVIPRLGQHAPPPPGFCYMARRSGGAISLLAEHVPHVTDCNVARDKAHLTLEARCLPFLSCDPTLPPTCPLPALPHGSSRDLSIAENTLDTPG